MRKQERGDYGKQETETLPQVRFRVAFCFDLLGRMRGEKPKEFTFLGFTHCCGKIKEGYFKVKRRTSQKRLGRRLGEFKDWAKKARRVLRNSL